MKGVQTPMKERRIPPAVAIGLVAAAILLVLWQFVLRRDNSTSGFSAADLPAAMKTDTPPATISGPIPRRSPADNPEDFRVSKGPPGRR